MVHLRQMSCLMRIKIFPLGLSNEHRIPVNTDVTAAAAASPARFSRRQKEFSIRVSKGPHLCRIIFSTDKDLRFYLMNYIEEKGGMSPKALNQWKFVPEEWTVPAARRDAEYLFGVVNK